VGYTIVDDGLGHLVPADWDFDYKGRFLYDKTMEGLLSSSNEMMISDHFIRSPTSMGFEKFTSPRCGSS
jgi:hypothetical protein